MRIITGEDIQRCLTEQQKKELEELRKELGLPIQYEIRL